MMRSALSSNQGKRAHYHREERMNAFSHERAAFAAGESCSGEDLLRLDFTALIQRVISLEEEKLDLQRLVCHLLVKNETLRSQVRQVGY